MSAATPTAAPVLLTGFEPFGGDSVNVSALAVSAFEGRVIAGHRIHTHILPVVFGESSRLLRSAISQLDPALVLCTGQASGRPAVSLERVALNLDDASRPDNAGQRPVDQPIDPEGPAALWSTLPLRATLAALHARGLPAELSLSAGSYVCNHVFYSLLRALQARPGVRGGFVHLCAPPGASISPLSDALDIVLLAALAPTLPASPTLPPPAPAFGVTAR